FSFLVASWLACSSIEARPQAHPLQQGRSQPSTLPLHIPQIPHQPLVTQQPLLRDLQRASHPHLHLPQHSQPIVSQSEHSYTLPPATGNQADFGVYFRNQAGNAQGVYTFFVHSNGTWSSYVYDNTTGAPTTIKQGPFGSTSGPLTLDVVVIGSNFSFYSNGTL